MSDQSSAGVAHLSSGITGASDGHRFRMGRSTCPHRLSSNLNAAIVGQDDAISAVVRALTIAAAGIRDPHRPIASLLFAGPTGVGKTELSRRLALEITGDPEKLCRIDMASLAQEHYAASLSGAPPGYSGSKEQFTLFDRELIEGNLSRPGIVLFDEVEKAHTTVLRSLLQILDTGTLRLTAGTSSISFRNCIVLLTSNLGSDRPADSRHGNEVQSLRSRLGKWSPWRSPAATESGDPVVAAVEDFFDPELFNRFDEIVRFHSIDRDTARAILDIELDRLAATLASRAVKWSPTAEVRDHLIDKGFDKLYGARHLKRTVRRELHAPIANAVVNAEPAAHPLRIVTEMHGGTICAAAHSN
ncbi:AAA family ATPase [Mycolicibacterium sp. S3B2]|uniref:AAA family ATPase n=1 Tax=Mycolicibacterium sp. S3B2 TaxID=3415120 RepID=UPI003C7D0FCD